MLGCQAIRINANTHDKTMSYEAMLDAFADGMRYPSGVTIVLTRKSPYGERSAIKVLEIRLNAAEKADLLAFLQTL